MPVPPTAIPSISAFIAVVASAHPSHGQTAEPPFELSPFTIEASDDSGYRATTTLAGTRLRSEIEDLAASIAIATKEFMEDIAATDGETLLAYVGNVEVAGTQGNFSSVDIDNASTNEARNNPQVAQRVRGLGNAVLTRDYFQTILPFDSYNTTRVTVNRGPNSILFGLGSPGGVINGTTSRAYIGSNTGTFGFRLDHRGGHRETLNINKTLIENRLAIRVAALNESIEYKQEPAFEDDSRFYVAFNAMLAEHERSNVLGPAFLRGGYEIGKIERNPPDVVPPIDGFSSWFEGIGGQEALNRILSVPGASLSNLFSGAVKPEWILGAIDAGTCQKPHPIDQRLWLKVIKRQLFDPYGMRFHLPH